MVVQKFRIVCSISIKKNAVGILIRVALNRRLL